MTSPSCAPATATWSCTRPRSISSFPDASYPGSRRWVHGWLYGLGSEAESLPSYVVMPDPDGALEAGQPMYMNGFLPASYQPTTFRPGDQPVLNLDLPKGVDFSDRKRTVDLIKALNEATMDPEDYEFDARVRAYDLAFKMQTEAPEVLDVKNEPEETLDLYGIGSEPTDDYGRRCLLARRLVERGTRFVCVVSGGGPGNLQWDAHKDIEENHLRMAAETDKPVAGLLTDLKRRGLLDETLVVWGGEFGRSPEAQVDKDGIAGRDHHNLGFTMWMAGGGVKGGQIVGATDAIGLRAVEKPFHFRDHPHHHAPLPGLGPGPLELSPPRPPGTTHPASRQGDRRDRSRRRLASGYMKALMI